MEELLAALPDRSWPHHALLRVDDPGLPLLKAAPQGWGKSPGQIEGQALAADFHCGAPSLVLGFAAVPVRFAATAHQPSVGVGRKVTCCPLSITISGTRTESSPPDINRRPDDVLVGQQGTTSLGRHQLTVNIPGHTLDSVYGAHQPVAHSTHLTATSQDPLFRR